MYDVNVLGTLRVTQALLPALEASGAGTIVVISSTAGLIVYEGGGGYTAAKHAQTAIAETLRLELCGRPVRVDRDRPGHGADRGVRAGPLRRRRRAGGRRLRRACRSRWSPTTSPTASPGAPPARSTSTSTGWWSGRGPRPPSTRCTGLTRSEAATPRPLGVVTRGTTNPNRLRRVDHWIVAALRATGCGAPDDRWWSTSATAPRPSPPWSCAPGWRPGAPGRPGGRAGDRPGPGGRGRAGRRPARADVRAGAGSSWPGSGRCWSARSTCCGSTTRPRWPTPGGR